MDEVNELKLIEKEYSTFFDKIEVNNAVLLVKLQDKSYEIKVSVGGWYTKDSKQRYPTFEALMMVLDENFNRKFNDKLFSALQSLEKD